jgi:putative flippase GtrA
MSSLIGRLRAFRESPHFTRIWKFGTVSLVATAVSQTILFIVYPHLVSSAMLSTVIATAISTVPAYYLNRAWTWGKRGKSHLWREVVPFWSMAFIGLVLAVIIVGVAAKNAHHISTARHFKTLFVHFAYLFSYALIWVARYSLINKFLFGTHTHETAGGDIVETVAVDRSGSSPAASAAGSAPASASGPVPTAAASSAHTSPSVSASVGVGTEPARPVDPSH